MSHLNRDSQVNRRHRVVVTGLGVASPRGQTLRDYWNAVSEPVDSRLSRDEGAVAECWGETFETALDDDLSDLSAPFRKRLRKSLKLMDRQTLLGVLAGQRALNSSGVLETCDPDRIGVCFGADNAPLMPQEFGRAVAVCTGEDGELDLDSWGCLGIPEMAPLWLLKCLPNMSACHLAILNDLRGPNNTLTTRHVAFGMALTEAYRTIRVGDADALLVGATGSTLSPLGRLHAEVEHNAIHGRTTTELSATDREPSYVPAEGAGAFVVENLQFARRRGAQIYGEILSSASASFVGHDGAASCGKALANAMRETLRRGQLQATSIGHIHLACVPSRRIRTAQSRAIEDVFGPAASQIPVLSTTSHLGHAGAGAGALQLAASLLVINHVRLFGTDADDGHSHYAHRQHSAECFFSLSLHPCGLSHCVAVGALHDETTNQQAAMNGGVR